ncbi:MAG TPA: SufE family protein [Verrucomicrobiota bacterium]|nr:SufE family protein [Verrucomicrobiota bacterium]
MTNLERGNGGSLAERQASLVAGLAQLRDPQARLTWAVERARQRNHLPDRLRLDEFRVTGCLVRLWLVPEFREGKCWFQTDSDAVTLRATIGLLCDLANGCEPSELAQWNPDFLERLGLLRQLAENRRATVLRVAELIRTFAKQSAPPSS